MARRSTVDLILRIPPELAEAIDEEAVRRNSKRNPTIIEILTQALASKNEKHKALAARRTDNYEELRRLCAWLHSFEFFESAWNTIRDLTTKSPSIDAYQAYLIGRTEFRERGGKVSGNKKLLLALQEMEKLLRDKEIDKKSLLNAAQKARAKFHETGI